MRGAAAAVLCAALTIATFLSPANAQQCVNDYERTLQALKANARAGECAKHNKLMATLTDAAGLEFYAPGSPGSARVQGAPGWAGIDTGKFDRNSAHDFETYKPKGTDARWHFEGGKVMFNCGVPLSPRALPQNESFLECARIYVCAATTTACGIHTARATGSKDCKGITEQCMAQHPIPQGQMGPTIAVAPPSLQPPASHVPRGGGDGASAPLTPPPAPQQPQMSAQCQQLVINYVQAAQANEGARSLAGYNALKAAGGCGVLDKVDRPMPQQAAQGGDPRFQRRGEAPLSDATIGACDASPAECAARVQQLKQGTSPQAAAALFSHSIGIGLQLGSMLAGGMMMAMPQGGGAVGGGSGGTNMNSIGPGPVRSTYGQGAPSGPSTPNRASTITGIK